MDISDATVSKIMMHLVETAAYDGILTDEELELLSTIDNSLKIYKKKLAKVLEDGIVTEEEYQQLSRIKDIIINAATIIAGSDDEINKDEMNLIIGVMVSINVPKPTK